MIDNYALLSEARAKKVNPDKLLLKEHQSDQDLQFYS